MYLLCILTSTSSLSTLFSPPPPLFHVPHPIHHFPACAPSRLPLLQNINLLGKKARDGTIGIDDMAGGTFTISNGGVYGSLLSTPIINPPQSAILGMHATNLRPTVVNGKIEVRTRTAVD